MEQLLSQAAVQGVRVAWRDLGRRNGEYHSSGVILLNPRRSEVVQRVPLAHELGHAHYGPTWTDDPIQRARRERMADRFGARLLISRESYAAAELLVGPHLGALTHELGVTTVVEACRAEALRLGFQTHRRAG